MKALFVVALLGVPLMVISVLPRLFELASAVPTAPQPTAESAPVSSAFHLLEATPATSRKFANLDEAPPPTLVPPAIAVTPVVGTALQPTGERITIGNTGGRGAVLRSDPVTGRPVAALREQQVLDVLERRNVPGSGNWLHVRTTEGVEGWVIGLVALPQPLTN